MRKLAVVLSILVIVPLLLCRPARAGFLEGLLGISHKKTADLSDAMVEVCFIQNLGPRQDQDQVYDRELNSVWTPGGNLAAIKFTEMKRVGYYEIDGTVKLDGQPLKHLGEGVYAAPVSDLKPHTFTVETSTGKKYEFTVNPTVPVVIVQPKGSEIDLHKDVAVTLHNPPGAAGTHVLFSLRSQPTLFQKSWCDLDSYQSADQITIPAVTFAGRSHWAWSLVGGNSVLRAERYALDIPSVPGVGQVRVLSIACDYAPVQVRGADVGHGAPRRAKDGIVDPRITYLHQNSADRGYGYMVMAPGVASCTPLVRARKLAVIAFNVRADELNRDQTKDWDTTQTYHSTNLDLLNQYGGITTTYKTWTETTHHHEEYHQRFPKLPTEAWQSFTDNLYATLKARLQKDFNITLIPVSQVLAAKSYQDYPVSPDQLTADTARFTYQGLKDIDSAAWHQNFFMALAGMPQKRLMDELGVDGVVSINLHMVMPCGKLTLQPDFHWEIIGPSTGMQFVPSSYGSGSVRGEGLDVGRFKKDNQYPPDLLDKVVQPDALVDTMMQALARLSQAENELGIPRIADGR